MDHTVRLWYQSRQECLKVFRHVDCVTAICFHPLDETHFISGSMDDKLRIWNIPEQKVVDFHRAPGIVTAAGFAPEGKLAVSGCVNGKCTVYQLDGMHFQKTVNEKVSASKRGRNAKVRNGRHHCSCCILAPPPRLPPNPTPDPYYLLLICFFLLLFSI